MSIFIKMDMPKNGCKDCIFINRKWHGDICPILKREVSGNVERGGFQSDCPLVEVPEPHGRLIDADALRLTHCTECTLWGKTCFGNNQDCDWDCIYHIDHAETVIPAEAEADE